MGTVGATQAQEARAKMPQSRKASNSSLTNSGKPEPVSLDLGQGSQAHGPGLLGAPRTQGLEVFLYQLVEGGVFGTPPLVVDAFHPRGAKQAASLCLAFPLAPAEPLGPPSLMVLLFLNVTGIDSVMGLPLRANRSCYTTTRIIKVNDGAVHTP